MQFSDEQLLFDAFPKAGEFGWSLRKISHIFANGPASFSDSRDGGASIKALKIVFASKKTSFEATVSLTGEKAVPSTGCLLLNTPT